MGTFVLKNIDMTLDEGSIQKAINDVQKLRTDLAEALADLARYVTEELGVGIAKMFIAQYPAIMTSALVESINGKYNTKMHEGEIFTEVEYAVLVEYGTGIVGKNTPHPGRDDPDWINPSGTIVGGKTYSEYDSGEHGEAGWYYPAPWGWVKAPDGKMLAWTKGMPSRPFMYDTMRELENEIERDGGRLIAQYLPD